jgi:hypothetical protein
LFRDPFPESELWGLPVEWMLKQVQHDRNKITHSTTAHTTPEAIQAIVNTDYNNSKMFHVKHFHFRPHSASIFPFPFRAHGAKSHPPNNL